MFEGTNICLISAACPPSLPSVTIVTKHCSVHIDIGYGDKGVIPGSSMETVKENNKLFI